MNRERESNLTVNDTLNLEPGFRLELGKLSSVLYTAFQKGLAIASCHTPPPVNIDSLRIHVRTSLGQSDCEIVKQTNGKFRSERNHLPWSDAKDVQEYSRPSVEFSLISAETHFSLTRLTITAELTMDQLIAIVNELVPNSNEIVRSIRARIRAV